MQAMPFLRRDVVFLPRVDGVEFRTSDRVSMLISKHLYPAMVRLATQLDGHRTVRQVIEDAGAADRSAFTMLCGWLQHEGLLSSLPVFQPLQPELEAIAAYIAHLGMDVESQLQRLDDTRISIIGAGPIALAVARSTLALGMRVVADEWAPWLPRLRVLVPSSSVHTRLEVLAPGSGGNNTAQPIVIFASEAEDVASAAQAANAAAERGSAFLYTGMFSSVGLVSTLLSGQSDSHLPASLALLRSVLSDQASPLASLMGSTINATDAGPVFCGLLGQQAALTVFSAIVRLPRERAGQSVCLFNPVTLLPAVVYLDDIESSRHA